MYIICGGIFLGPIEKSEKFIGILYILTSALTCLMRTLKIITDGENTGRMDLNVKPLRCFIALAEEGSFTAAANRMHMTQPSLSAQIRSLEQIFGFALFERTTRSVQLTAAGTAMLASARLMISSSDQLIRLSKGLVHSNQNKLSIGSALYTASIFARNTLIEEFGKQNADIQIFVDARLQTDLIPRLYNGELDLCLLLGMPISRSDYQDLVEANFPRESVYPDDFSSIRIGKERACLQVPPSSALAKYNDEIPLDALNGLQIVGLPEAFGAPLQEPINRLFINAGAELVFSPEPTGMATERYGRTKGIPAISLGWVHEPSDCADGTSIRKHVQGLHTQLELVLACIDAAAIKGPAKRFWHFVSETCPIGGRPLC